MQSEQRSAVVFGARNLGRAVIELLVSDGWAVTGVARSRSTLDGVSASGALALKADAGTKKIPYVILSGDRDIAQKARQCGADDFLGKPFEFPDLIRLVDKYATES